VARFKLLESRSRDVPIKILINSPGGVVSAGLLILDAVQSLQVEVHTICLGLADSMAAILLAAGTPGHRSTVKDATIGFSSVSCGGSRTPEMTSEISRLNAVLIEKTVILTGLSADKVERLFESGKSLSANEAMGNGIVDEVVSLRSNG